MKIRRFLPLFLTLLVLASIGGLQSLYDASSKNFHQEEKQTVLSFSEPLLPKAPALEFLSLGDRPLVADIIWLQTIQYFGAGDPYGNYPSLGNLLDTITQLDPKYDYPYQFGLVALPFMKQADIAVRLGERAEQNISNDGLITYYLATDYQLNIKDYRKAAFYYQKAIKQPGAPEAAKLLAGASLDKISGTLNDRLVAATFWKTVYDNAKDPNEKEQAKNWYEQISIVYTLEKSAIDYQQKTGHFPASLQELVTAHYLDSIPASPVGRRFDYDPTTGKISFDHLLNPGS